MTFSRLTPSRKDAAVPSAAVDDPDVWPALAASVKSFDALIRGADPTVPVPGTGWTVGETAAHILSLFRRMTDDLRRGNDRASLAALNELSIGEIGTDLVAIAAQLDVRHDQVQKLAMILPRGRTYPFHAGAVVTYDQAGAVVLGEVLVHGDDIARALRRPWAIDPRHLLLVWQNALHVLAGWLRPGTPDQRWIFRFAEGLSISLWIRNGVLTVGHEAKDIDAHQIDVDDGHHIIDVGDVVEFTLGFPYGRRPLDPRVAPLAACFAPV
jgi:hypothetical protein